MVAAPTLQFDDPATICPFSKFVFVKLADAAFERLAPSGPIIPNAIGKLPTAHGKCDARSVNADDRRLVDEKYSLCARHTVLPLLFTRPQWGVSPKYVPLIKRLTTNDMDNRVAVANPSGAA